MSEDRFILTWLSFCLDGHGGPVSEGSARLKRGTISFGEDKIFNNSGSEDTTLDFIAWMIFGALRSEVEPFEWEICTNSFKIGEGWECSVRPLGFSNILNVLFGISQGIKCPYRAFAEALVDLINKIIQEKRVIFVESLVMADSI